MTSKVTHIDEKRPHVVYVEQTEHSISVSLLKALVNREKVKIDPDLKRILISIGAAALLHESNVTENDQ